MGTSTCLTLEVERIDLSLLGHGVGAGDGCLLSEPFG